MCPQILLLPVWWLGIQGIDDGGREGGDKK